MRIAHITASLTESGGGIPVALRALVQAQTQAGATVQVMGHADGAAPLSPWPDGCPLAWPVRRFPGLPWAAAMADSIHSFKPGLLHTHGLWSQGSVVVPRVCQRAGIPYLVSPHGMLDAWAVANSRWKKHLAAALFENRHLRGAACLHALCESEAQSIRAYGLKNPICVIPNGVQLPEEAGEELSVVRCPLSVIAEDVKEPRASSTDNRQPTTDHSSSSANGPRILLFLGRLHPKKGLVNALKAWKQALHSTSKIQNSKFHEWQFVISGWDQGGHEADLKKLCDELGVAYSETPAALFTDNRQQTTDNSSSVIFTGPAFGEHKDMLLRRASAFILPSFSEGLPMSVLEAWAYRLPVLMTDHCNLPEGFLSDAALRIGTDAASIAEGMRLLLQSPATKLQSLGANGRALVQRQFTWPQIADQLKEVYDWLLGGGDAPDCVRKF